VTLVGKHKFPKILAQVTRGFFNPF